MNIGRALFVAWQDTESRRILPIGRLLEREGKYEFAYVRAVNEARDLGFEPLLTFPEVGEVYRSTNLPPLFSNRIIPRGRPEFAEYARQLGLTIERAEPFTMLSRSGGRRTTDTLEVFAPPERTEHGYEGLFLARGVRHVPGSERAIEELPAGSKLFVMHDLQNEMNSVALALRDGAKHLLGYVPDYLANELHRAGAGLTRFEVVAERINLPPAPVHHRMLCRFRVPADVGQKLFDGDAFQPLSDQAAAGPN